MARAPTWKHLSAATRRASGEWRPFDQRLSPPLHPGCRVPACRVGRRSKLARLHSYCIQFVCLLARSPAQGGRGAGVPGAGRRVRARRGGGAAAVAVGRAAALPPVQPVRTFEFLTHEPFRSGLCSHELEDTLEVTCNTCLDCRFLSLVGVVDHFGPSHFKGALAEVARQVRQVPGRRTRASCVARSPLRATPGRTHSVCAVRAGGGRPSGAAPGPAGRAHDGRGAGGRRHHPG